MSRGSEPGYRPQPKLYKLVFDDHPGLVCRARSTSVGGFLEISKLSDIANPNDPQACRELFRLFSNVLVSWNLEQSMDGPLDDNDDPLWLEGDPVPVTLDGIMTQDLEMVLEIIEGWMEAAAGVSAPLAKPSSGGRPSLVESLPMVPLSQSQVS